MKFSIIIMTFYFIFFPTKELFSQTMPDYNPPVILARANIADGYNLPPMSFLSNTSPVINNNGDIAFKIMSVEGENTQAFWVKHNEETKGEILYLAPGHRFMSDPILNESGKITFNLYDEGVTDGLFVLDTKLLKVTQVINPDSLTIQYYNYPQIQNSDELYFRGTDDSDVRSYFRFKDGKVNKFLSEGDNQFNFSASYLFRPTANSDGLLAFKALLGNFGDCGEKNPDIIYLMNSYEMKGEIIASDKDFNKESGYLKLGNTLSLSNNGAVAFTALLPTLKRAIVVYKNKSLSKFVIEGQNDIFEIDMVTPQINGQDFVLFRAKNNEGKRGLYLADGIFVKKLIEEGDEIDTDLGKGKILNNPNFPGIGGEVSMNDKGEIVFYCQIVSLDNKELGLAIYKITPKNLAKNIQGKK